MRKGKRGGQTYDHCGCEAEKGGGLCVQMESGNKEQSAASKKVYIYIYIIHIIYHSSSATWIVV